MPTNLTSAFNNSSIRTKLSLLIVLSCSVALLLSGGGFLGYEAIEFRKTALRQTSALAEIIGASSTAALSFGDDRAESEVLTALRGDPEQTQAVVYNSAGRLFASYRSPRAASKPAPPHPRPDGVYFEHGALLQFHPVSFENHRIGTILLEFSMKNTYHRLWSAAEIILLMILGSLAAALLLVAKLQRTITMPVDELSRMARRVSEQKDYSVRAEKFGNDETGRLVDSFNEMLSRIETREKALHDSEERYVLAAKGSNDGLWDWKIPSGQIFLSSRWKEMLGYSADEIGSGPAEWFSRIHPGDRERVKSEISERTANASEVFSCEYRIMQKSGLYIWVLCRGIGVHDAGGRLVRMAGSQTDITEGKVVDSLTGLRNRLYFIDKLDSCLSAPRDGLHQFAVFFIDLDRFKVVNDSLGHDAGDRLLIEVAVRLQSSVRASDLVARDAAQSVIARFGGDEFAILLQGLRSPLDASVVAERILVQLAAPVYLEAHPVFVSASIGIAPGESGKTPEDLLRNADAAMYFAKTRGKGRFEIFNEGIRDRALARLEVETDIREAVDSEQFVVYYQPEVSLRTGKTVGFEALLRWQHPERGLLQPSEFIPIAEETGLIVPIGRWVLRHACFQMAEWHRTLKAEFRPSISVNMSLKQLADPGFVNDVVMALSDSGLNPPSLRLELTESSIMENSQLTLEVLRKLKALNVGLELDDFGTGYSSLSYLHQLPFDAVKIDRSFINGMPAREGSAQIVETILGMARSMNLDVVAEGVETAEQRDQLVALGCPIAQGFYFSRPADRVATEKFLREKNIGTAALADLPGLPLLVNSA